MSGPSNKCIIQWIAFFKMTLDRIIKEFLGVGKAEEVGMLVIAYAIFYKLLLVWGLIALELPHFIILQLMDSQERLVLNLRDFFEQAVLPLRLPVPPSEADSCDPHERFAFNLDDSLGPFPPHNRLPPPKDPSFDECHSIREDHDYEDTNPLDELLNNPHLQSIELPLQTQIHGKEQQDGEFQPSESELEKIISFLVEYSNLGPRSLQTQFCMRFPGVWECSAVRTLVQKFIKLKKTKEELVKYCMRKAFKYILELPKNKHILDNEKEEKFSFAKSKNRYLKKISDEKSMNSKFLQQIFHEGDFSSDYKLFLQRFESIIEQDNRKKVKYLAWLLAHENEGKGRSVEMVRRMPWTSTIMQRARKVSFELLKFASG